MPGELNPNFIYSHVNISFFIKTKKKAMPGELNPNFIYSHGNISFLLNQKISYAG